MTHRAKKSALGLVLAILNSTAKRTRKVAPMIARSLQFNLRFLLRLHEPKFTVIAPTTPMAYKSANDSKLLENATTRIGNITAIVSGSQGTPCRFSLAKGLGISPSRASR